VLRDPQVNAVMIATRHASHARLAAEALQAGKHAYVEKPLAMSEEQLAPVLEALAGHATGGPTLWLGHNRRYAPLARQALAHFAGVAARQITITVRAAAVPADSWYQDPVEGGGTLFGDVCHFIDLAIHFAQSLPVEVHALETPDPGHREESWLVTLRFASGGLATVHYTCGSQEGLEREVVEILGGGRSARLAGFQKLALRGGRGRQVMKLQPDLGQRAMIGRMLAQFQRAPGATDETESFVVAAQALLAAHRSIRERRAVEMGTRFPFAPE
jgi:polar amino acid transport system substrate-binding protein